MSTIREVAEKAGVSPTTVSHVVNNTRYVSAPVRERVLQAMAELGYRPNALARSLRRGETKTLGLILPDSANPFFAEIGRAIEAAAFSSGYSVILCNTEGDPEKETLYTDVLAKKQVDGLIFVTTGDNSSTIHDLLAQNLPMVVVDRDPQTVEVDVVLTDNRQCGYLATQHLIQLGHKRIGCIMGPSNVTPSALRITGYREAMRDNHLPVDEAWMVRGDFHPDSGYRAALELLRQPNPVSAIFVCNDMMAIGALRAAHEFGLHIPEQLSIVGVDNIDLASYTIPPLTTITQPKVDIGQTAFRLLVERIQQHGLPARRIMLSSSLIIRNSTGRPA
ncbi:MAG: LacI family DNA-binding transcriptional regulator [Anaerolineaceae bacterium]